MRAQHDQVAVGVAKFGDGAVEVGIGRLVAGGAAQLQAHRLHLRLRAGQHVAAVVGVLIHHADRLHALRRGEMLHPGAHLIVVRGELAELQPVERLVHRARAGGGEHVRHVLLDHRRHDGVVHRRAAVSHGEEDVVAVQQLVHRLHRLGDGVFHVLDDEADLAAVHAALGIRLIERHAHAVRVVDALHGGDAGQVGHAADDDLVVADPARGRARDGGANRAPAVPTST